MFTKIKGGKVHQFNRAKLESVDAESGRTRLSSPVLESLFHAFVGISILERSLPTLSDLLTKSKTKARCNPAMKMLSNSLVRTCDSVSLVQLASLEGNLRDTVITVSSTGPTGPDSTTTTIEDKYLSLIAAAAKRWCRDNCIKEKNECVNCQLREAFDATFCTNTRKEARNGFCPHLFDV